MCFEGLQESVCVEHVFLTVAKPELHLLNQPMMARADAETLLTARLPLL